MDGKTECAPVNRGAADPVAQVELLFNRLKLQPGEMSSPWDQPIEEIESLCLAAAMAEAEREMQVVIDYYKARVFYGLKRWPLRFLIWLSGRAPRGFPPMPRSKHEILRSYLDRASAIFGWADRMCGEAATRLHALAFNELKAKALALVARLEDHLHDPDL